VIIRLQIQDINEGYQYDGKYQSDQGSGDLEKRFHGVC
jgi:hypothetical protein